MCQKWERLRVQKVSGAQQHITTVEEYNASTLDNNSPAHIQLHAVPVSHALFIRKMQPRFFFHPSQPLATSLHCH
jgi:hypothetical protein